MARDKEAWKAGKRHTITLASSAEVDIVLPNLIELLAGGEVPNELVQFATKTQKSIDKGESVDIDQLKQSAAFVRFLVARTVVDPVVSEDEVPELPAEDVDMLLEFATRQRDLDALYHHIGGLHKQEDFRNFRSE